MSTIVFDVDGCIADFVLGYTKEAKKLGFLKEEFNSDMMLEYDGFNITREQQDQVWEGILQPYSIFWMTLRPLISRRIFEQINNLCVMHQVVFVTSRQGHNPQSDTTWWLRKYGITTPSVIITKRKGEIARALDADYSLEDKPENAAVIHWMADVKPCKSYIIDRPYNRVDYLPKKIKRVKTVEEFLNDIE